VFDYCDSVCSAEGAVTDTTFTTASESTVITPVVTCRGRLLFVVRHATSHHGHGAQLSLS